MNKPIVMPKKGGLFEAPSPFQMPRNVEERFIRIMECPQCHSNLLLDAPPPKTDEKVYCPVCGWRPRVQKEAGTTLYHIAPTLMRDEIGAKGIRPTRNMYETPRTYFFQTPEQAREFYKLYQPTVRGDIWEANLPTDVPLKVDPLEYGEMGQWTQTKPDPETGWPRRYPNPRPLYTEVGAIPPEYLNLHMPEAYHPERDEQGVVDEYGWDDASKWEKMLAKTAIGLVYFHTTDAEFEPGDIITSAAERGAEPNFPNAEHYDPNLIYLWTDETEIDAEWNWGKNTYRVQPLGEVFRDPEAVANTDPDDAYMYQGSYATSSAKVLFKVTDEHWAKTARHVPVEIRQEDQFYPETAAVEHIWAAMREMGVQVLAYNAYDNGKPVGSVVFFPLEDSSLLMLVPSQPAEPVLWVEWIWVDDDYRDSDVFIQLAKIVKAYADNLDLPIEAYYQNPDLQRVMERYFKRESASEWLSNWKEAAAPLWNADPSIPDEMNPVGMPRPLYEGLPVPWTSDIEDHPDQPLVIPNFSKADPAKIRDCWAHDLCVLCGLPLTDPVSFFSTSSTPENPEDNISGVIDGPLHPRCAKMTRAHCPHIRDNVDNVQTGYGFPLVTMPLLDWQTGKGALGSYSVEVKPQNIHVASEFDAPLENPVNYQFVPFTPNEIEVWKGLDDVTKMKYRRRARGINQRARKVNLPGRISGGDLYLLDYRYQGKCAYCGLPGANSFDHVEPIGRGGDNTVANVLPAHITCNKELNDWDQKLTPLNLRAIRGQPNWDVGSSHDARLTMWWLPSKTAADVRELAMQAYLNLWKREDMLKLWQNMASAEHEIAKLGEFGHPEEYHFVIQRLVSAINKNAENPPGEPNDWVDEYSIPPKEINLYSEKWINWIRRNISQYGYYEDDQRDWLNEDDAKKVIQIAKNVAPIYDNYLRGLLFDSLLQRLRDDYPGSYKIWPWFIKQMKGVIKQAEPYVPEYLAAANFTHYVDIAGQIGELLTKLRQENKTPEGFDINRLSINDAETWLKDYHAENVGEGWQKRDVLATLSNGWTIEDVTTEPDLRREGELMGHCVGGYCSFVASGQSKILSLRDPKGMPHATMEYRPFIAHREPHGGMGYQVQQIQGKSNREPVDEYKAMIKEFNDHLRQQGYSVTWAQGAWRRPQQQRHYDPKVVLDTRLKNQYPITDPQQLDRFMEDYQHDMKSFMEPQPLEEEIETDEYGIELEGPDPKAMPPKHWLNPLQIEGVLTQVIEQVYDGSISDQTMAEYARGIAVAYMVIAEQQKEQFGYGVATQDARTKIVTTIDTWLQSVANYGYGTSPHVSPAEGIARVKNFQAYFTKMPSNQISQQQWGHPGWQESLEPAYAPHPEEPPFPGAFGKWLLADT